LPFTGSWYAWDIIFIVEPIILAALFLALLLPSVFGLVSSEIGSRRPLFRGRGLAITALLCMFAYWIICDSQHRTALRMLDSHQTDTGPARRLAAQPYPSNPFHWFGIAETGNPYETFDINTRRISLESNGSAGTFFKPPETPATLAAKTSYLGRVYLDWARFPVAETTPEGRDTYVYLRDVRHILPIVLQLGLFASPVAYGIQVVPRSLWWLYSALNPLAPVIDQPVDQNPAAVYQAHLGCIE